MASGGSGLVGPGVAKAFAAANLVVLEGIEGSEPSAGAGGSTEPCVWCPSVEAAVAVKGPGARRPSAAAEAVAANTSAVLTNRQSNMAIENGPF